MFEYIFGIDNVVPIDIRLDFEVIIITRLCSGVFFRNYSFPCQSLLLSTTVYVKCIHRNSNLI